MKLLIISIITLAISCKSTNNMESNKLSNDNKYLLSLSKEKNIDNENSKTTIYKNISLKKVLNIESGDFVLSFKNNIVFEGNMECLFLLEVFNNEILLVSTSNSSDNKYVAGPENFKRNKILLIDIATGNRKIIIFQEDFFLKSYRGNLNKSSNIKNVFVVDSISYETGLMRLEDAFGKYKDIKLIDTETTPFKCDK